MLDWTARRYRIIQLLKSEIQEKIVNERRQAYIILNERIISKVRIIGTVRSKISGERNYTGVKIHDGSGEISCKTWDGSFDVINEWDLVEIIGRVRVSPPREGQGTPEIYINPDLVIPTTEEWDIVHRLELLRNMPASVTLDTLTAPPREGAPAFEYSVSDSVNEVTPTAPPTQKKAPKAPPEVKKRVIASTEGDLSERLEQLIRELDEGEGVSYETIADKVEGKEGEIDDALFKLLMDSKIYEPRPGRYRLIDS
ncbi:MAG: hypothetical protein ACFFBD_18300 [Candidatus Hodarchaeota archaeon]